MQQRELGEFLRSRRNRLDAADLGFPAGADRRVPGLRREELAVVSGVGVSWLTRIEQGRATTVSAEVLDALAQALRLSDEERRHLFRLAGVHQPSDTATELSPAIRRLVDGLAPNPCYVLDPAWNLAMWNDAEVELFPLLASLGPRPNLVRIFLDEVELRTRVADWELEVRRVIGQFRAHVAAYPTVEAEDLIAELHDESPQFVEAWEAHDVEPLASHGRAIAGEQGVRRYEQHRLPLPDHPGWLLVVFVRTE